jgi:alpha-1,3-glucosyltransferase
LNIFYKLHKIPNNYLLIASISLTLFASIFSLLAVISYKKKGKKSNLKKITLLSFFITSLSFFLFSFHVHEKTILVPLLAFMLCFSFKLIRNISKSFYIISLFSLYPLLKRENQEIPYVILMFFIYFLSNFIHHSLEYKALIENKEKKLSFFSKMIIFLLDKLEYIDCFFIVGFHVCEMSISPPTNYPWFYPLINSSFAFAHFVLYYLIANVKVYLLFRK